MEFTEEQIEFIGKCIDNTNIELYPGEWEELKKELRKRAKNFQMRKTAETAEKLRTPCLRFSPNSAMNTFGLRKPCGTCNFQAR